MMRVCRSHKDVRHTDRTGRLKRVCTTVRDVASKIKHVVISGLIGMSLFRGLSTKTNTAQARSISSRRLDCENLPHFLYAELVNKDEVGYGGFSFVCNCDYYIYKQCYFSCQGYRATRTFKIVKHEQKKHAFWAETNALIGGRGVYSHIHVLPDEFLLKSVVIAVDFKRNSSGRMRIYEYAPPPQLTL